jgi:hypothetical protein
MRRLPVVLSLLSVALFGALVPMRAHAAPAADRVEYQPPVDAPVVDGFRPPPEPWAAGNRGLDYGTTLGQPVRAAAAGVVVFAGQVGGTLHVSVLHADGIRTTYSFLATIAVHRGDRVDAGQVVGTAGDTPFHLGAIADRAYVDPALLFDRGSRAYLVPDADDVPATEADERAAVARLVRSLLDDGAPASASAAALAWARDGGGPAGALGWAGATDAASGITGAAGATNAAATEAARVARTYLGALDPSQLVTAFATSLAAWFATRSRCTPATVPTPRLTTRHLAVLVGGLGSSSGKAAVLTVGTGALGYAPHDVVQFSYRGGTADADPYTPADTEADIAIAGRRLRDLIVGLAAAHPGVPIDVIAHSEGGLAARAALVGSPSLPVASVTTLGTPHLGTDLATAADALALTRTGRAVERVVHALVPAIPDPSSRAVREMSGASTFVGGPDALGGLPPPPGVHVTSIGADGDLVVPAARTYWRGATNVVVAVPGWLHDHDGLPGSPAAQRELALAITGAAPTCASFTAAAGATLTGLAISRVEVMAGALAWLGAERADRRLH